MLSLWRRHVAACPHAAKGRRYTKCDCPIWTDGTLNGARYRKPLDLRDWTRAVRKVAALEDPDAPPSKPIEAAVTAFAAHCNDLAPATQAKYKVTLRELRKYSEGAGLVDLLEITLEHLDLFRAGRNLGPLATLKELQRLRYFFGFCLDRGWVRDNVAKRAKGPRNIKPTEVAAYRPDEVARIIAACDGIGRGAYERLRARALVLLLLYTGLRITDAITLERDRIKDGRLFLRTGKTGKPVLLRVVQELQKALEALPVPRGTTGEPRYCFWKPTRASGP